MTSFHTKRTPEGRAIDTYRFVSQQLAAIHRRLSPGAKVTIVIREPGKGEAGEMAMSNGDDYDAVIAALARLKGRAPSSTFSSGSLAAARAEPPSARRARREQQQQQQQQPTEEPPAPPGA